MRTPVPALLLAILAAPDLAGQTDGDPRVDALFANWNRPDSPGAAVLVLRDGKVVHRRGYGMADLEHRVPITPRTVFDIASVSKQFCGLAIAMLIEQGKLAADDDVRKHVPWVPDFGAQRTITVQHLLHHTSGLRDWPGMLRLGGWRYDDVIRFDQILDMLRQQRDLNFQPGERYCYSNTGYNLLAHLVEKSSGLGFATWTKGHLFDPLGMRDTHFHDDHTRLVPNRAHSYRRTRTGWQNVANHLTAVGSSSLFTTIDDLARWILNFETGKVGGKAALARMHTRGKLNDGRDIAYCYGVARGSFEGLPTVAHSGSWAGFRTYLVRFPEQRFAVVVLANTADFQPRQKAEAIARLYLDNLRQPAVSSTASSAVAVGPQPVGVTADELREYGGRYHSAELDTTYRIVPAGGGLAMRHFRTGTVHLRPHRRDHLLADASWVGAVHFLRNASGAVTAFTVTNSRSHRVRFDRLPDRKD